MPEKHLKDSMEPVPYECRQCENYIEGVQCKAFDTIPIDYFYNAEAHSSVDVGQHGDYTFRTSEPRKYDRVYIVD